MNNKQAAKHAKQAAWQKKKEQEGKKVVYWIFGILIAMGALFAILGGAM